MKGIITPIQAAAMIPDGASIMIGGFMGCGNPHSTIKELAKLGTKDLTIYCNDGAMMDGPNGHAYYGLAKLIHNGQVKKLYASHVGLNPEVGKKMIDGSMEVILVPQGSLAEMIRAGGAGLGGILTPVGIGTIIEDQEYVLEKITIEGKEYLLKKALRADFALIGGQISDKYGNVWYKGTTRNFNLPMATAADTVIAEVEEVIDELVPENVHTFGVLVDHLVIADAVDYKLQETG